MEQVTENVYTNTKLRGCNPSFVTTSDGVVVIDTPQLPTKAVEMRAEAETHGPIRYLINTEHHIDHIFGNYFFKGSGTVVHHQGVYDNFMVPTPELNPYNYAKEALPTDDPAGEAIFPDEETYFEDPNKASIVFTGDNISSECQTWLMTSDVAQWLEALERIKELDFDYLVPGHGPVTDKAYIDTQRFNLMEWETAVAAAVAEGWSREETIERVHFRDKCSVDTGQEYKMDHIQENNAAALYDKLSV